MNLHRLPTSQHRSHLSALTRSHTQITTSANTKPARRRLWSRSLRRRVERAYRVPWRVSGRLGDLMNPADSVELGNLVGSSTLAQPSMVELTNESRERLRFVRFALASEDDRGSLSLSLPRHIEPGESVRVSVRSPVLQDALLTVRWFRPDGHEYLWLVSF